jgi:ERF superfamily
MTAPAPLAAVDTATGEVTHLPHAGLPNASATIGKIAAALAKAQGNFGKVVKDKKADVKHKNGGSHSYQYATLAGVLEAVREPLSAEGITFLQPATVTDRAALVRTILVHADSGEWIADPGMPMPVNGVDAQAVGSAITYARRYGLTSLLGIAQEDDDGAAAKASPPPARQAAPAALSKEQAEQLVAKLVEGGMTKAAATAAAKGVKPASFGKAMERAQKLVDEQADGAAAADADEASAAAEQGQVVQCPECFGNGDGATPDTPCARCEGTGEVAA